MANMDLINNQILGLGLNADTEKAVRTIIEEISGQKFKRKAVAGDVYRHEWAGLCVLIQTNNDNGYPKLIPRYSMYRIGDQSPFSDLQETELSKINEVLNRVGTTFKYVGNIKDFVK